MGPVAWVVWYGASTEWVWCGYRVGTYSASMEQVWSGYEVGMVSVLIS